jgi:sugar phosphate isomerase/epimerase
MTRTLNRRTFLTYCPTGVAAVAAAQVTNTFATGPVQRNGTPKFKFSLAAYSYRDLLNGKEPKLTLFDFADDCAKMQLEGTELTSYYFPNPTTPEYLNKLKGHCFRLGLDISGTAVGNDFGLPPGERRQQQIDSVKRWIDNAVILGAPVIRIFAGHEQKGMAPEEAHRLMVSGMEECCEYAGQRGVYLALENHGGPTATIEGIMKLIHGVKSPWFGVNLDTGNFHGDDIYRDLAQLAPYSVNVQVKVVVQQGGKRQPMDFPRVAKILRDVGYRGYIVLEYEEKEDPRVVCPEIIDRLRAAFA